MRCPRCGSVATPFQRTCQRCGYVYDTATLNESSGQRSVSSGLNDVSGQRNPSHGNAQERLSWSLMRGDVLSKGRYRLAEEVTLPKNQQGVKQAWLATDNQERSRVLLQRVEFSGIPLERTRQEIQELVRRMAPLAGRPGLSPIIDVFYEQNAYYIVQHFPIGESLADLMKQQGGTLPEQAVVEYGRQICEMLVLLNAPEPPLLHGSISPETILISPDMHQASLIYLPLFPLLNQRQKDSPINNYAAPEQTRGDLQPSSDLYSLAATMHHAVTGFDPHERMVFFYPAARRLNPLVSQGLETILTRQLRFSTTQRYMQPQDMQKELAALLTTYPPFSLVDILRPSSQPPAAATMRTTAPPQSPPKKSRPFIPLLVGSLLFACLIIVLSSFLLNRSGHATPPVNIAATGTAQANLNLAMLKKLEATEMQSFKQKGIGLSDGGLIFDIYQGRSDVDLKQQAATAIQQGNMSAAVNLLNQAVSADPADGEAQIYNEDLHILQNNSPYATLALGLPIANSATYLGSVREQMEAVYLAQHLANSQNLLPNGLKLRIVIANSGSNNADVATTAQFIANRVTQADNPDHFIGVIGWYNTSQTINARDIIAGIHLPLIAPTASSVKLTNTSPYFFRICPPDDVQGQVLGSLLVSTLKVKHVLLLRDPTDAYSTSLANAVAGRLQAAGVTFKVSPFTENKTTVNQYEQIVTDDANSATPADAILLAGFNVDGIRLAHAVGEVSRMYPANLQLARLKVVGGDAIYSGLLLGQGNNADALLAQNFPQDISRLIFTTFADFNEWNFLNIPQSQQPEFFHDWATTYQGSMVGTNAPNPGNKGIMAYDVVGVFTAAGRQVHGPLTGDTIRSALLQLGKQNVPAYQGVGGRILFDSQGNPTDKALVILAVEQGKNGDEIAIQKILGTFR